MVSATSVIKEVFELGYLAIPSTFLVQVELSLLDIQGSTPEAAWSQTSDMMKMSPSKMN